MSDPRVSIVMYHYVRRRAASRYDVNALDADGFRRQLDFFRSHYRCVSMEDCVRALGGGTLPPDAVVLTFDDGYLDHYVTVFPELQARQIPFALFPPAQAVLERRLLDVHKLHVILAVNGDHRRLAAQVAALVAAEGIALPEIRKTTRFDSDAAAWLKGRLQRDLPRELRRNLLQRLWREIVGVREEVVAEEWYLTLAQLRHLRADGAFIGGHGWDHQWAETLSEAELQREIDSSRELLEAVGASTSSWVMCYPFGQHPPRLLDGLRDADCAAGLTTRPGPAVLSTSNALTLERFDTNDFPSAQ